MSYTITTDWPERIEIPSDQLALDVAEFTIRRPGRPGHSEDAPSSATYRVTGMRGTVGVEQWLICELVSV